MICYLITGIWSQGKESSQALVRSIDEIKRDLAKLDLLVETDVEIMSKLLSKFSSTNVTMEQRVAALLDLEYLVHQVINFIAFIFIYY